MQDVRLAIRSLTAAPIVTCVAIVSLALGIGANTAVFSILNSLFVRPLPIVEPRQLVAVSDARSDRLGFPGAWTYAIWSEIRDRAQGFDGACALVLIGIRKKFDTHLRCHPIAECDHLAELPTRIDVQ